MSEDLRRHPRFRIALRVHLALPAGVVRTTTVSVSRTGMSVRLAAAPPIGEEARVTVELPSGTSIDGVALTRNHLPGTLVGFLLEFSGDALTSWEQFVDEEERTGGLWRMIGRVARAPDDVNAPRGISERVDADDLKLHTVGENGEAYRIAFARHESMSAVQAGLPENMRHLAARVLVQPVVLKLDDTSPVLPVRVVALVRGGFAWLQTEAGLRSSLVSLCVGELMVVMKNGASVFPHFTDFELEQVACDTFRRELSRPVFTTPTRGTPRPAPVALPPMATPPPARFREGFDAVRFAQAASEEVQVRRYGDREIYFHPAVWAKVTLDEGPMLMGPTLQDGGRVCVLALVGPGAPRVVRLEEGSRVTLLKAPATGAV